MNDMEWLQQHYRAEIAMLCAHAALPHEANHTLVQCLTGLRAIDYVISKQTSLDIRERTRNDLYQASKLFLDAVQDPMLTQAKLTQEEKKFNTHLIESLHEMNLTKGCSTKKDAEALLAHYTLLSSVLDPNEMQDPMTEKTGLQNMYANVLSTIIPYPLGGEINIHTQHNEAEQQATACFADLLVADDRRLITPENRNYPIKNIDCFKKPSNIAYQEYDSNRTKLEELLKRMSNDSIYTNMKSAAEKILRITQDRSRFKAREYTQVNEIYKLVTHVLEHAVGNQHLDKKVLNDIGLDLQRMDKVCQELSKKNALVEAIKKIVEAVLISLSILLMLNTVAVSGPVFVVAGVIVGAVMKLGASLGLWQEIGMQVLLTSFGSLSEKSGHGVIDKTRAFSKEGHAFFKAEVKKLDTKKDCPVCQDDVEENDVEKKGGSELDPTL